MDLNSTLMWMVVATCVIVLVRPSGGASQQGRRRLSQALLVGVAVGYVLFPGYVGYVMGAVWGCMLIGPGLGTKFVSQRLARRQFARANALARWVARLYPFDGYQAYPQLVQAIAAQHQGRIAEAGQLLESIAAQPHPLGWTAKVLHTRLTGDWEHFVDWIDQHPERNQLLAEPMILEGYLQGLGELHRFDAMCRVFEQYLVDAGNRIPFSILNVARLKLAAFAGQPNTVEAVLTSLPDLSPEICEFWRGTAWQASGCVDQAQPLFLNLTGASDHRISELALKRLGRPVPVQNLAQHDRHVRELFREIPDSLAQEAVFSPAVDEPLKRAWGTWFICILLLAAFAVEIPGGTTDTENLIRLGALIVPASAGDGNWTRVITAAFLHFGSLHLILNMAGLILFGNRLESLLGALGLLAVYLTTAIGSVALVPWFTFDILPQERMILVGASGGVMGLIGGMLGFQFWSLFVRWNALIAYDFRLLMLLVAVQSLFDIFTPNVSTTCHLLGLTLGAGAGLFAGYWRQRRASRQFPPPHTNVV